jgi:hypothetical protein
MSNIMKLSILSILLLTGCNDSKSDDPAPAGTTEEASAESSDSFGGLLIGNVTPKEGADESTVSGATISVESHPEIQAVTDDKGNYSVSQMPPGKLNIFIISEEEAALTKSSGGAYGIKLKDIVIRSGETTDQGSHALKETGNISGNISFFENPSNAELIGADVYIPGTDFIAKTDTDGKFMITGLPEGSYKIRVDHTGFASLNIESVEVLESKTTNLENLSLSLSNGPEGGIDFTVSKTDVAGASLKLTTSRSVDITLNYDGDATLMKISDESSFLNKSWVPVAKTSSWTFDSDGHKRVYVMYSDLNGLESSPYFDEVIVDTESPVLSSAVILNGWAQTSKALVFIDLATTDTGSGIKEYLVSEDGSNFSTTIPFADRVNFTLTGSDGANTIYFKARDFAGNDSNVMSDSINILSSGETLITAKTYTEDLVFLEAQSPYLIASSTVDYIFKGKVTFEPGVELRMNDTPFFENVVKSVGTSAKPIVFTNTVTIDCNGYYYGSATMDFDNAEPGVSEESVFKYTHFKYMSSLLMNGGLIENSSFLGNACSLSSDTPYMGSLTKNGLDNLTIKNNVYTQWQNVVSVNEGDANTVVENISGSSYGGVKQSGTAKNTIFRNSTIAAIGDGAVFTIGNDNPFTFENVTINGGIPIKVENRTTDITFSNINAPVCNKAILVTGSAAINVIVEDSTFNCTSGIAGLGSNGYSLNYSSTAQIILRNNDITVSEYLIGTSGSSPANVQFLSNDININCGLTDGNYCDIIRGFMRNNHQSPTAYCYIDEYINATLTGNNLHCKGNTTAGCRGITFALDPKDGAEEAEEHMTVGSSYACSYFQNNSRFIVDLNGNYFDTADNGKALSNAANLQTSKINTQNYEVTNSDVLTLNSEIRAYEVMNTAANVMDYTGFPTNITVSGSPFPSTGPQ